MKDGILRALLKVGLKLTAPYLDEVALTAIEEGSGMLLDQAAKSRAQDVEDRLLQRMKSSAADFARVEGLSTERMDYILPTVEEILRRFPILRSDWARMGFQPDVAARIAIDKAESLFVGFSEDDRGLCRILLASFFTALSLEREFLIDTEAEFRRQVLARLSLLPEMLASQDKARAAAARRLAARSLIRLPQLRWRPGISPPGALLRADYDATVPFHGREEELAELAAWCRQDAPIALRLYTGAGGMGKTRLMLELCQRLGVRGFCTGFLDRRAAAGDSGLWHEIATRFSPLLIVVDYAETRRDELRALLTEAYRSEGPLRIVLLARRAGDWWEAMKGERGGVGDLIAGPATERHRLRPVAISREERQDAFFRAARSFAATLEKPEPDRAPDDLGEDFYERVLFIQMQALVSIAGIAVQGDQGLLDDMLARERRFWDERLSALELPSRILLPAVAQAMTLVTLAGGARSREDAMEIARQVPLLADQPRARQHGVMNLLHETYPGDSWIEPLVPDLLGEHLVQVEVGKDPDTLLDLALGPRQ